MTEWKKNKLTKLPVISSLEDVLLNVTHTKREHSFLFQTPSCVQLKLNPLKTNETLWDVVSHIPSIMHGEQNTDKNNPLESYRISSSRIYVLVLHLLLLLVSPLPSMQLQGNPQRQMHQDVRWLQITSVVDTKGAVLADSHILSLSAEVS